MFSSKKNNHYFSSGINCFCGNTTSYPIQNSAACTAPCSGNSNEICGDSTGSYFSVYSLR